MTDKLHVQVTGPPAGAYPDEAVISLLVRNRGRDPILIVGCVLLLPVGLRLDADAPGLPYPVTLYGGDTCVDGFSCAALAHRARQLGYTGKLALTPIALESGGLDESMVRLPVGTRWLRGIEHRGDTFAFDIGRWG